MRGFPGPGVARDRADARRTSTSCSPRPTASPRRREPEPAGGNAQPELGLGTLPAPRALPVSRLSYSGLEAYRRCSYRFYLERALRLPRAESPAAPGDLPDGGLGALLRGSLVHELLERLDFERPAVASEAEVGSWSSRTAPPRRPEEVADLRDMVERFAGSELFARIARARARAHGAAVRLHAVAAGRGRAQPARQRRGGRARRRVRTGCSWSTTRATPSTAATRSS